MLFGIASGSSLRLLFRRVVYGAIANGFSVSILAGVPPLPVAGIRPVMQEFLAAGQTVGFLPGGWVLTNGTFVLQVQFEGASPVQPITTIAAKTKPAQGRRELPDLGSARYENPWPGVRVEYHRPPEGILYVRTYIFAIK